MLMRTIRYLLFAVLLLLPATAFAQEVRRDSVKVFFRQGKSQFDPVFQDNVWRLTEFSNKVKRLQRDSTARIEHVRIIGSASPEGTHEINLRLTHERARSILEYLHPYLEFDENACEVVLNELDWDFLGALVREDGKVPSQDAVLRMIGARDLDGLKKNQAAWNYMLNRLFPEMRSTVVDFEYMAIATEEVEVPPYVVEVEPQKDSVPPLRTYSPPPLPDDDDFALDITEEEPGRSFYLKTNLPLWALFDANLGIEFELGRHMSVSVPVIYSALNWITPNTRFRCLGTQPELRFWLFDDFHGPFIAAHGTFGLYNVSLTSMDYRIQDRDGRTPTYGAGLNAGWKFRLDRNRADRWGLELSAGLGYLHLDFDRFVNVENGPYVSSGVEEYFGPDHASIAITYRFGR